MLYFSWKWYEVIHILLKKICIKLFISWFYYQHKFSSSIWHVCLKCIKFWDEYQRKFSLFKTNLCFVWVYLVWGKVTLWMVATSAANYAFCNKKKFQLSDIWISIFISYIDFIFNNCGYFSVWFDWLKAFPTLDVPWKLQDFINTLLKMNR